MKFVLDFTESSLIDLDYFKKHEQNIILDAIDEQLPYQPNVRTRNRKDLDPNVTSGWELRIGAYRVFYDITYKPATVTIRAIGYKVHNTLYIRGKVYII